MANYNIVIDSKFDPFTMQELYTPVMQAQEKHEKMEEAYALLAEKAGVFESLKNKDIDKDSYETYNSFMNTLEKAREELYSNGLSSTTRNALSKSRAAYASTIEPMHKAAERREKESMMQYQAELNNPYLKFDRDATNTPLSAYMEGVPDINAIDGTKLTAMASQVALPYAKSIMNSMNKKDLEQILPFQYRNKIQYGLSPEEFLIGISEAAQSNPKSLAGQIIKNLQQQVLGSSGLMSWNESRRNEIMPWAMDMINTGLNSLIGEVKEETLKDDYGIKMAELAYQSKLKQEEALFNEKIIRNRMIFENSLKNADSSNFTQDRLYKPVGDSAKASKNYNKYNKYFKKDSNGKLYLTEEGKKGLIELVPGSILAETTPTYSSLAKFLMSIGVDVIKDDIYTIGSKFNDFIVSNKLDPKENNNNNLAFTTIYSRHFNDNSGNQIIKNIGEGLGHRSSIAGQGLNKDLQYEDILGKNIKTTDLLNGLYKLRDLYINPNTEQLRARVYKASEKNDGTGGKHIEDNNYFDIDVSFLMNNYPNMAYNIIKLKENIRAMEYFKDKKDLSEEEKKIVQDANKDITKYQKELYNSMATINAVTEISDEKADINK